jgi:SAM-dependent methyltransferase
VLSHLTPWLADRRGSVLEVGCGAMPYRRLLPPGCRYQGLDWAGAETAFGYASAEVVLFDGGSFPFPDAVFDNLFHTEVLEHVPDPARFLAECRRVLAGGGELFISVPFQARFHYIPHDYWRFTPSGLLLLLERAGFADIRISPRGTDLTVAACKTASLVYRLLQEGVQGKCFGAALVPLAGVALLIGHLSLALHWGSHDDCLGYAVTARAI